MKLIFDCYMLLHNQYSGIPHMAYLLINRLLKTNEDCIYSIGYRILERQNLQAILDEQTGANAFFELIKNNANSNIKFLSQKDFNERLYFSTHTFSCIKTRGLAKARIIHDISPINFPEFHTSTVRENEGLNLMEDIHEADLVITISEASKIHIQEYFSVPKDKIVVCANGIEWSNEQILNCNLPLFDFPYALVLGTIEPRKNLALIASWLIQNAQRIFNSSLRYVIAGPNGWGEVISASDREKIEPLIKAGKLVFAGFVPEKYKMSLLAGAKYLIYPSFCEGFGLPVAEALSVGTPVITSYAGALPEPGGKAAFYFSPYSLRSLSHAIDEAESALARNKEALRQNCMEQAKYYNFDRYFQQIMSILSCLYETHLKCKYAA